MLGRLSGRDRVQQRTLLVQIGVLLLQHVSSVLQLVKQLLAILYHQVAIARAAFLLSRAVFHPGVNLRDQRVVPAHDLPYVLYFLSQVLFVPANVAVPQFPRRIIQPPLNPLRTTRAD